MIDDAIIEQWMREANPIPDVDEVDADEFARFVAAAHTRGAVMQAPTQHVTSTGPVTPPPQRRRKAWALAAAIVLIFAAVGIAAFVARGGEAPVADEPMVPATTSAADPFDVQSLTWSRVPGEEAAFNPTRGIDLMSSVTVGGPGFVAVGTTEDGIDASFPGGDGAVWVSEDGITWSLQPNDEPPLGGPGAQVMEDVTAGGPGLVAVGVTSFESLDFDYWGDDFATVWISIDGITWSRVLLNQAVTDLYDPQRPDSGSRTWMRSVAAGGPGLVAVGSDGSNAAVWTSVEGVSWSQVPHDPLVFGSSEMSAVIVGGPGLVAVGGDADAAGDAAVWTSPDGFTWSRVSHDEAVFGGIGGQGMADVVAGGPGLVAVGSEEPDIYSPMGGIRAVVWTSPDGLTWTRLPHDPELFGGESGDEQSMSAVTAVGSQLVAVGGEVWASINGLTWTRHQSAEALYEFADPHAPEHWGVHDAFTTNNGLIAVGEDDGAAAVWIATPED